MKTHLSLARIFISILAVMPLARAGAQEMRTWTDKASGKTVEAAYVSADATTRTVKIRNAEGKEFELPVARLNEADIAYIRQKLTAPPTPTPTPAAAPAAPGTKPAAPAAPVKTAAAPKGQPAPPKPEFKTIAARGFKGPAGSDFVKSVQRVRPRLLQNAQGWAALKDMAAKDPAAVAMLANLKKSGELLLAKPEMTRVYITEASPVNPGSQTLFRVALLGALNFIDGDPKWKERAVREMVSVTDNVYGDWYPGEPTVTTDHLIAGVLAYDWFKDGFNAGQLAKLKEFIHLKGVDPIAAHLKNEPVPATAKKVEPGTQPQKDKTPAKAPKKREPEGPELVDADEMGMYSALVLAAICMVDDDPPAAKKALEPVGKMFSKGLAQFSPGGVWPEGMEAGDRVMDHVAMVLQTLRSACGNDFGLSVLEGIPEIGAVRMHLTGPTKYVFNYGDAKKAPLARTWVSSWLSGVHGNPGLPATAALPAKGDDSVDKAAFLDLAGQLIYHNPQAAGYRTPEALDFMAPGGEAAALRSSWDSPAAMYVAMKGGRNEVPAAQLDIGSFVLDAGGVRWAEELGPEDDKAPGFSPDVPDRNKRYALYLEGTKGQNTLVLGGKDEEEKPEPKKPAGKGPPPKNQKPVTLPGNQELDAKAAFSGAAFQSSAEKGVAILNMTDAYHKAKSALRGILMMRGTQPYVLLQDDLVIKGTSEVDWQMHTKTDVTAAGNKATLTSGKATLTAALLSPAGAEFVVEDPPAKPPGDVRNRDLQKEKVKVLKVRLKGAKGEQRIAVAFALGTDAPSVPVVPIAQWVGKK
ncbi:MAG: hypothetical protein K1X78_19860 [Verrucomicrobiaceae bacterium]|nr:hypothetical protein [Verrucomicrobiaceae bacterium]